MLRLSQTRTICQQLTSTYRSFLSMPSCSPYGGHRHVSNKVLMPEEMEVECLPNSEAPWLMLPPEIDKSTGYKFERFYSPAENRYVKLNRSKCLHMSKSANCVGSTIGGWLSYVDPNNCSIFLANPYSNDVVQLPSLTTLPSVLDVQRDPGTGAVINLHMGFGYSHSRCYDTKWMAMQGVTNVALSWFDPRVYEAVAVAIQGEERRLVYCPIGKALCNQCGDDHADNEINIASDTPLEWLGFQEDYRPGCSYHQTVYSQRSHLFYTIFENTGIQAYDLETDRKRRSKLVLDLPMEYIDDALKKDAEKRENVKLKYRFDTYCHSKHYYLVPPDTDHGDLLLLVKHYQGYVSDKVHGYKTFHFDVFKIDLNAKELERVDGIGEYRSIFVGLNQSFSVSDNQVPGLRPNCIYFSDHGYDKLLYDWGYDHGIFDLSENRILPLLGKVPFNYKDYYCSKFWVSPKIAW